MHIIVVGRGAVGSILAEAGSRRGDDVVVVDADAGLFRRPDTDLGGGTLRGTGCEEQELKEAGIEHCDALVAATDSDFANIMAAEIATMVYHVPRVVVRLCDPGHERSLRMLGLDYVSDRDLSARTLLGKLGVNASPEVRVEVS